MFFPTTATCLSVGAVAGIVVACFVALVLIIVAIILILRQRNGNLSLYLTENGIFLNFYQLYLLISSVAVDQRLRTITEQRKKNLNNRQTVRKHSLLYVCHDYTIYNSRVISFPSKVLPAPQNGHDNPGFLGQGDQPDPPLHYNRMSRSKDQQTTNQHNINNDLLIQNRTPNTRAVQPNGNLNTGVISNDANLDSNAHLHNSQWNGSSNQHNRSFQQVGQQNPNILIQTGHAESGPHTVLINLNTLPQHQNATTQPHTVQVSLSAPQPSSGPNQNNMQYNDQQSNAIQQEPASTSHSNLHHVSGSHSNPQTRMDNILNTAQPANNSTLRNGQPRNQRVTNQTRSRPNTEDTFNYSAQTRTQLGRALSVDYSDDDTHPRQMPWDRIHGTPQYPNPQMDSYESHNSTQQNSSLDSESEPTAPDVRSWRSPVNEQMRSISRSSRRNFLRQLAHSAAQRRSRADRNMLRQVTQSNVINQPRAEHQSWTAPQNIASQRHGMNSMGITVPISQQQTVQIQPNLINQAGPDQRQSGPLNAAIPNTFRLTQAALQQHTIQAPNPFVNRIHQTQSALQHPGTQSTPPQTAPARQTNRAVQAAPEPPPVLRPAEFKMLPRKRLNKPESTSPVQVMRRPVVVHHGHRAPNMTRHARPMPNNLHKRPVNPHKHDRAHWHGTTHGLPVHMSQVRLTLHKDFTQT